MRQTVVVHHCGGDTPLVLVQVIHYRFPYFQPRFGAATTVALPRISNESGTDRGVSAISKMGREQFVDELLFGLPLYMNQ